MIRKVFAAFLTGLAAVTAFAQNPLTFSVMGDSYSTFRGSIPEGYAVYYPVQGNDVTAVEKTWWGLLSVQNGWKLEQNNSYSGSTICTTGYGRMDYTAQAFVGRTHLLGNPDLIFVFGGTNDAWANSPIGEYKYEGFTTADLKSFRPAVACMLERIRENNPKSKVFVLLNSELKAEIGETFNTVSPRYGAHVIELKDIEKVSGHPTYKGMQAIAGQVTAAVNAVLKADDSGASASCPVIEISTGKIQGFIEEGTMAFKGIPYAKAQRFMPPTAADSWEGVRQCTEWGPQAMQGGRNSNDPKQMSEDCCVLNVWTTDLEKKKPVMLWCHGGGFDSGTSAWNPGMGLAKKDVVVVSLNHRLNIMGFLDLSATGNPKYKESGNVGMLDVVEALKWIKTNIAKFGGDPGNVTVFGESGGGGKVGTLMCMPAAKGLYHKAIVMSGTILNVNTNAMSKELGLAVLKELDIPVDQVEKINDVPYDKLYQAGQRAMAASIGTRQPGTPMMWGFGPTPDGEVLLQQPFQPGFAKISDNIPLVIGTTFNELARGQYQRQMTLDQAKDAVRATFGDETDAYAAALAKAWPDYVPQDLPSIDPMFRAKTLITIDEASAKRKAPLYNYMFTWKSPLNGVSAHGAELNFCFNTLHLAGRDLPNPSESDLLLADRMAQSWANFAHTGDPNVEGLPKWHPYTKKNGECFIFSPTPEIRNNFDRELQELINSHCFKKLEEFYATHK